MQQYMDLLIDALLDEGFTVEEASKLIELRETPTVSAICGNTSRYSRVETPRSSAPSRCWRRPRFWRSAS